MEASAADQPLIHNSCLCLHRVKIVFEVIVLILIVPTNIAIWRESTTTIENCYLRGGRFFKSKLVVEYQGFDTYKNITSYKQF